MAREAKPKKPLTEEQQKLITDNFGLIFYALKFYDYDKRDYEDLLEYCFFYACDAARNHNPEKGKFSSLLCKSVKYAVYNFRRDKARHKDRDFLTLDCNIESDTGNDTESYGKNNIAYLDKTESKLQFWDVYDKVLEEFNTRDKFIITKYYIDKLTEQEISDLTSITRQRINIIIHNFRDRFKEEYGDCIF